LGSRFGRESEQEATARENMAVSPNLFENVFLMSSVVSYIAKETGVLAT
jgi:hypothetical protein